jgi:DHA1 family multidrug resistance protein-like MFS transporter
MPRWKANVLVLCAAQLLTQMGFSAYLPSMSFFVQDLLGGGYAETTRWVALLNSVDSFAMMAVAPLWGALADRFGRKLMVGRATLAGSLFILPMAFVTDPSQLLVLRAAQGIFCGTVSAAMTLVATETPEEHLGFALGLMQMAQFVGRAIGPTAGGLVADAMGWRAVYPLCSGLMGLAFLGIVLFVREHFVRPPKRETPPERRGLAMGGLHDLLTGNMAALLFVLWALSMAMNVVSPVLPLYVKALRPDASHIATLAGATMSVTALTSSLAALTIGRLGDRRGQKPVLIACVLGAVVIYIPQALVSTPVQLLALRAIEGVFVGGMTPASNALLAKSTPASRRGAAFGLSASMGSAGRAMGPLAGAAAANTWGMPSAFWVTAVVYAVTAAVVSLLVRPREAAVAPPQSTPRPAPVVPNPHPTGPRLRQ